MIHLFKYRFLYFIKNKSVVFWTLIFPIGLATLFNFAFGDLGSAKFEPVEIAVVQEGNATFEEVIKDLGKKGDDQVFKVTYIKESEVKKVLDDKKVDAVIKTYDVPQIVHNSNSLNVSITKEVVQSYMRTIKTIEDVAISQKGQITQSILEDVKASHTTINTKDSKGGTQSFVMQYFYTVIAMASLYGAFWGLESMKTIQANQSAQAIRLNVAPTSKVKMVIVDFVVAYVLLALELVLAFMYMIFVLNIDFSSYLKEIILICASANFMSVSLGIMVGALSKLKEDVNLSILSMGSLFSCFLAGMMAQDVPYAIDKVAPIVKYINPATLITNCFNTLSYKSDISQIYTYMLILIGMGIICLVLSFRALGRKKYASI